ncbi:hypothetical protein PORY_001927 [Pneumocystis oryctolagi]|uniref:Uncharacterized protein n=1 Tax=Pneumocystis oryctolagi TaxID=42067 RepID=A0ACB7CH92_9ASCO|nr:hypothetical protein PORY_001927 [Pneumocystis oryctolagi]
MKQNKREKVHVKSEYIPKKDLGANFMENVFGNKKIQEDYIYDGMWKNSGKQSLCNSPNSNSSYGFLKPSFSKRNSYFHLPVSLSSNDFNIELNNNTVVSSELEKSMEKFDSFQKNDSKLFSSKKQLMDHTGLNSQDRFKYSLSNDVKYKGWIARKVEIDRKFSGFSKSYSNWKLYMAVLSGLKLYLYIPSQVHLASFEKSLLFQDLSNPNLTGHAFSSSEFDLNVRSILYDVNGLQKYFFGIILTKFESYLQGFEKDVNSIFLLENALILCYRGTSIPNKDLDFCYNSNAYNTDLKNSWKFDVVYNIYDVKISFNILRKDSNSFDFYNESVYLMVISNENLIRRFILSEQLTLYFLRKYILLQESLKKTEFHDLANTVLTTHDHKSSSLVTSSSKDILLDCNGTLKAATTKGLLKIILGVDSIKTDLDVLDLFSTSIGFWDFSETILKIILSIVLEISSDFSLNIEKMIDIWCNKCCGLFQDSIFVDYVEELIKNGVDSKNSVLGEILKNKVKDTVLIVRKKMLDLITIDMSLYTADNDDLESALFIDFILEIPSEVFSRELYYFHKYYLDIWDPSTDLSLFFNKISFNLARNPLVFGLYNMHFITRLILDQLLKTNNKMSSEFKARICSYWISVSIYLKNYGDMTGCLSIIIALCSPPIIRLKKVWSLVDPNLRNFVENFSSIINDLQIFGLRMNDKIIDLPCVLILENQNNVDVSTLTIPYYGEVLSYIEFSKPVLNVHNKIINVELYNDIFVLIKKNIEKWKGVILANKESRVCINETDKNIQLQGIFKRLCCARNNPQSIFSDIFFKKSLKCEPPYLDLCSQDGYFRNTDVKVIICASLIFNYIYTSYNLLDFKNLSEICFDSKESFFCDLSFQMSNTKDIHKHRRKNSFPFSRYSMFTTQNCDSDSKSRYKAVNLKDRIPTVFQNIRDVLEANQTLFYYTDGQLILRSVHNILERKEPSGRNIVFSKDNVSKASGKLYNNVESIQKIPCQVVVKAGSLNRLVDVLVLGIDDFNGRLICESDNSRFDLCIDIEKFRLTFLSTFRSFCSPSVLLEHFKKRLFGSKAVASRIGIDIKVSEYAKNNEMFPDWDFLDIDNNNLLNYDFYLKIHIGVLECIILWLNEYFCDFVDNLDLLNGFYSFYKIANSHLQNWKEIVLVKNELHSHMVQYFGLFEKATNLFIKLSYRPQIEPLYNAPIRILQEIDISKEYNDDEILDLARTLDKLVAGVFNMLKLEDWIYCSELLEVQCRDVNSFFEHQQSTSFEDEHCISQDIYSLLSQVQKTQTHDLLINSFPHSIRQLFELRRTIIEWVIGQITDINIDCSTRVDRILLYLRLLGVYQLTVTRLDFFFGPLDSINWAKNKSVLPSFVGNAIAAALVRSESRLFIYAWSIIASKRGLNGQVEDLASVIPLTTSDNSYLFTPCIGWVFEHLLKIVFYIPNVIGNFQHINFIKQVFIYDFILHVINSSNYGVLKADTQNECNNVDGLNVNIQIHDIRTLEMVSENENYPLRFTNIGKPFESLIQEKITMVQKDQRCYEDMKKCFREIEKESELKSINIRQSHKNAYKKMLFKTKDKTKKFSRLVPPNFSAPMNNFNLNGTSDLYAMLPSGFSAIGSKPSDIIDLSDSLVSSLEISKCEYMFKIKPKNGMKMLLRAPSFDEHKIWYQNFKELPIVVTNKRKNVLIKNIPIELNNVPAKEVSVNSNSIACYGVDLMTLCIRDKSNIPKIANDLINEVENRGLEEVGIYRVPGSVVSVNALKAIFDSGGSVNLKDDNWLDINVIAGALKLWLRELPEPLMTYKLYSQFIALSDISDYHKRIILLKALVQSLPPYNYFLVKRLIEHFEKVVNYEAINQMHAHNLAIIFGPSFLQPYPSDYSFSQTVSHLSKTQDVELKQKIRQIAAENDLLFLKLSRMKRSIQRLRLERAFIFEKLEEHTPSVGDDSNASDSSLHSLKREKDSSHSETHDPPHSRSGVRDTVSSFAHSQSASSGTTTNTRRRRVRDPDAPKRPSNPFLKFCDVERERIRSENQGIDRFDVTRALGAAWQNLDDESRKPYYDAYELEKKRFKMKMDQYENENSRVSNHQSKSTILNEPSEFIVQS